VNKPAVSLDLEVVGLLADQPELLAIADAVAATQPQQPARSGWARRVGLAAILLAVAVFCSTLPFGGEGGPLLAQALAAVGRGPVVHARIEAQLPTTNVVDLATGRSRPQTVEIEYWFDEPRGRLRTRVRRGGVAVDEFLQTRSRATAGRGPVRVARGAEPALDPGLAGFVTRYRRELGDSTARRLNEDTIEGRKVVWLELAGAATRERVAVDRETYAPVRIVPLDARGRAGALSWRVRLIESTARVEADFAPPRSQPPRPFRGDVRVSRPLSSGQAGEQLDWAALWLGQSWRGLRLVSLERETLTRGYPPTSATTVTRAEGLRLRYAIDGTQRYAELSQAPFPEPAYAFSGGAATFDGNPIPPEGSIEIVELSSASDRTTTVVGQLRRDGVYVTVWASSRQLTLQAARALRRITGRSAG